MSKPTRTVLQMLADRLFAKSGLQIDLICFWQMMN